MKTIAVSLLALGAAFATPALANEATHNGLPVAAPSVESVRANAAPVGFDATTQSTFFRGVTNDAPKDAARGSQSGT